MSDFLLRALLGGIGVALVAGPLGCFVVWRRMAFFGDALAHAALLGVALGFLLGIDLELGVLATSLVFAGLLVRLQRQRLVASDTLLAILSYGALSAGLVAIAFMPAMQIDLLSYLFGDILAVGRTDLVWIWGGGLAALAGLLLIWRPLLAITLNEELAAAEGVPVERVRLAVMLLVALLVGIAMKIVGILLITALMILPAAAVRPFSRTPEQMAALSSLLGVLSVVGGLGLSLELDAPAGPSVVLVACVFFAAGQIAGAAFRRSAA
ncbi:MAG: iron chelate uptake ABC transporter family permease subunit [Pseudomonadota bacterium]